MSSPPDRLLRRLEWHIVRRLDGQLQGAYRTMFRGTGVDFDSLREYTPEDDVRHIDWNVTARLDEPYVRQYTEDRELTVWLVLDQSASMRFGSAVPDGRAGPPQNPLRPSPAVPDGRVRPPQNPLRPSPAVPDGRVRPPQNPLRPSPAVPDGRARPPQNPLRPAPAEQGKDSVLAELAVCLARLFTHSGNRVGAILYDNAYKQVIPPRTSRTHVLRLTHELTKPLPARPFGNTTDLAAMLHLAASTARRRSLVFVISDFIGDVNWEPALTRLNHRHEVVTMRVVDPMELDLPDLGLILIEDAETGEQLLADTSDPLFQQRLRDEVEARESVVAAAMKRAGVTAHRIGTDEDLAGALVDMVRRSKRRRA